MSATNVAPGEGKSKRLQLTTAGPPANAPIAAALSSFVEKVIRKLADSVALPPSDGRVITRARWLGTRGFQDEPIRLQALVNSAAAPCGTAASFEVFNEESQASVEVLEAQVEKGQALTEFTWKPEEEEPPAEIKLLFKVKVGEEQVEVKAIPFFGKGYFVKIRIQCDPEDPGQTDDSATLESTCGGYNQKLSWAEGEKVDNGVILTFTHLEPDKLYNLLIDPGSSGPPYYAVKNVQASKDKLKDHMGACA